MFPCSSLLNMGTCTAGSNASICCRLLAVFLEPPNRWCVAPNSLAAGWSTLAAGSEVAVDTALLWCTLSCMPVPCIRRKWRTQRLLRCAGWVLRSIHSSSGGMHECRVAAMRLQQVAQAPAFWHGKRILACHCHLQTCLLSVTPLYLLFLCDFLPTLLHIAPPAGTRPRAPSSPHPLAKQCWLRGCLQRTASCSRSGKRRGMHHKETGRRCCWLPTARKKF